MGKNYKLISDETNLSYEEFIKQKPSKNKGIIGQLRNLFNSSNNDNNPKINQNEKKLEIIDKDSDDELFDIREIRKQNNEIKDEEQNNNSTEQIIEDNTGYSFNESNNDQSNNSISEPINEIQPETESINESLNEFQPEPISEPINEIQPETESNDESLNELQSEPISEPTEELKDDSIKESIPVKSEIMNNEVHETSNLPPILIINGSSNEEQETESKGNESNIVENNEEYNLFGEEKLDEQTGGYNSELDLEMSPIENYRKFL